MTIRTLTALLAACASIGCSPTPAPSSTIAERAAPSDLARPSRSIEQFRFITKGATMAQVIQSLGEPDRDAGSGIHIFVYRLSDGSEVWIGTPDASEILYVRHGTEALYEKDRPAA
jgi:hypothetical protein